MIVLDASAALEVLLNQPAAGSVRSRLADPAQSLHAPDLIWIEVASALRRFVLHGDITDARGRAALDDLGDLGLRTYPLQPLAVAALALRDRCSTYDASYVALATELDCPLVTGDVRLARGIEDILDVIVVD